MSDIKQYATARQCEYLDAVEEFGSQAKAANALGINVRTLERGLAAAKAQAAAVSNTVVPERTVTHKKGRGKTEHVWIPDTQIRPGVRVDHIYAAARYIAHRQPDVVIIGGDWYDMPSLNSYEKPGSSFFEGVSYRNDIDFGNEVMAEFLRIIRETYYPRIVFVEGNHEYRIQRAVNDDPVRLRGVIGREDFDIPYVEFYNFLEIVSIDGIMYSHYFVNPQSAIRGVLGGTMDNRLNKLKGSFTQGHQQTLQWGAQDLPNGNRIIGCVAGAFYQHHEAYAGPQGQNYWRGIIYKHEVEDGEYDPMPVSMDYLLENWSDA